jgi:hypothetical protein
MSSLCCGAERFGLRTVGCQLASFRGVNEISSGYGNRAENAVTLPPFESFTARTANPR